jgi:hypothetical protein
VKIANLGAKFVLACGEKLALENGGKEVLQLAVHCGRPEFLGHEVKLLDGGCSV